MHHNSKQTCEITCFYSGRLNAKNNYQKRFKSPKTGGKCSRKKIQLTVFNLRLEEFTLVNEPCNKQTQGEIYITRLHPRILRSCLSQIDHLRFFHVFALQQDEKGEPKKGRSVEALPAYHIHYKPASFDDYDPNCGDFDGYDDHEPDYDDHEPDYGDCEPDYDDREPNYDPDYDDREPDYDDYEPDFDDYEPDYGDREPDYDDREPDLGDYEPDYGEREPDHDDREPDYDDYEPDYDDYEPDHDDREPDYDDYEPDYDDYSPSNDDYDAYD